MNVKEIIQKEVDAFVWAMAELYNPLIAESTPDEDFEGTVETVTVERDQLIDNLLTVVEVMIEDSLEEAKATEVKKEARLRKLVPADIVTPKEAPQAPVAPYTPPVMESSATPPRQVKEATTALELPQDFTEAAQQALSNSSLQMAGPDMDLADNADYTHNLGLTLAEEKRREMGLPIKLYRPTVNFGMPEKPTPPPTPKVEVEEAVDLPNFTLEEIEEAARGK